MYAEQAQALINIVFIYIRKIENKSSDAVLLSL